MAVEKRFLKYVSYWTTSEDDQESIPSTKRQFELANRAQYNRFLQVSADR